MDKMTQESWEAALKQDKLDDIATEKKVRKGQQKLEESQRKSR